MLYLIALLEWFTTLAVQMIALRLATPLVGSSIVLTSVFIGIILLALSAGYYLGWWIASRYQKHTLRKLLAAFLIFSWLYYGFITFLTQEQLLQRFLSNTGNYITTLFVVAILLFFLPVLIDAQTIPLLTELLPESSKGKAAWSMLFASTIGSFLWSVGTSIVLFESLGVRMTGVITCVLLFICSALLLRKTHRFWAYGILLGSIVCALVLQYLYVGPIDRIAGVIYHHDSAYQEILVRDSIWQDTGEPARYFHTDRAFSSWFLKASKESPFDYLVEVMKITDSIKPKLVLVIGTAWFTYPYQLAKLPYVEQIDAVDIDPSIKRIAEEYFFEETLSEKIHFIPQSARYVLHQAKKEWKRYDLILVDAYNGKNIPDELATQEFFADLKAIGTPEWIVFNFILDSGLETTLAKKLLTTVRSVFPAVWTKNVTNNPQKTFDNFIATTWQFDTNYTVFDTQSNELYTDDKRSTETDLVTMWWGKKSN